MVYHFLMKIATITRSHQRALTWRLGWRKHERVISCSLSES